MITGDIMLEQQSFSCDHENDVSPAQPELAKYSPKVANDFDELFKRMRVMTRDEAIERLRAIQEPEVWEPQLTDEAFEALEMGIDALKNQDAKAPKKVISRSYAERMHNRIIRAIMHILNAIDVDDLAKDIAVEATREQLGKYAPYLDQDPDEHEAVIDVLEEMEVET